MQPGSPVALPPSVTPSPLVTRPQPGPTDFGDELTKLMAAIVPNHTTVNIGGTAPATAAATMTATATVLLRSIAANTLAASANTPATGLRSRCLARNDRGHGDIGLRPARRHLIQWHRRIPHQDRSPPPPAPGQDAAHTAAAARDHHACGSEARDQHAGWRGNTVVLGRRPQAGATAAAKPRQQRPKACRRSRPCLWPHRWPQTFRRSFPCHNRTPAPALRDATDAPACRAAGTTAPQMPARAAAPTPGAPHADAPSTIRQPTATQDPGTTPTASAVLTPAPAASALAQPPTGAATPPPPARARRTPRLRRHRSRRPWYR